MVIKRFVLYKAKIRVLIPVAGLPDRQSFKPAFRNGNQHGLARGFTDFNILRTFKPNIIIMIGYRVVWKGQNGVGYIEGGF